MFYLRLIVSFRPFFLLLLPLTLLTLQSCSGTPIGQNLANSFDDPSIISDEDIQKQIPPTRRKPSKASDKSINNPKETKPVRSANALKKSGLDLPIVPFTPQPYRITIKLSGANPSAPAETVTNALRKAGVRFEVEKIERVEEKPSLQAIPIGRTRR